MILCDTQLDVPLGVASLCQCGCACVLHHIQKYLPLTQSVSSPVQSSIYVLYSPLYNEVIFADDLDKHTLLGSLLDVFLVQVCICVCHHGSNRLSANIQDHLTAGSVLKSVQLELELSNQL